MTQVCSLRRARSLNLISQQFGTITDHVDYFFVMITSHRIIKQKERATLGNIKQHDPLERILPHSGARFCSQFSQCGAGHSCSSVISLLFHKKAHKYMMIYLCQKNPGSNV